MRFVLGFTLGALLSGGAVYASRDISVSKVKGSLDFNETVSVYNYETGEYLYVDVDESIDFICRGGYIDDAGYGRLRRCSN